MSTKGHSLDDVLDQRLLNDGLLEDVDAEELFERGFTAYRYSESIFLSLKMSTYVKTKCPINDSEDIIKVTIEYRVNKFGDLIEHHSFLNWIDTFETIGMGLEATCTTIYDEVDRVVKPNKLKVHCTSHSNYRSTNEATREKDF